MGNAKAVTIPKSITGDGFESVRRDMLKLNPGQMVQGKLVDIEEGKHNKIYVLDTVDGELAIYGGAALESIIHDEDVGMEFRIKYNGMVKSKKRGRKYHDFEVACKGKRKGRAKKKVKAKTTKAKKK